MSDDEDYLGGGRANAHRWSTREDDLLQKLVEDTGTDGSNLSGTQWTTIAKRFGGRRRAKECRERWENKLRPGLREGQWSKEEHDTIMRMAAEQGHVWRLIAAAIPGRSPASVKNYYYSFMRRLSRAEAGKAPRKRRQGAQPPVDIREYKFTGLTAMEEAKSAKDASSATRKSSRRRNSRSRRKWMWSNPPSDSEGGDEYSEGYPEEGGDDDEGEMEAGEESYSAAREESEDMSGTVRSSRRRRPAAAMENEGQGPEMESGAEQQATGEQPRPKKRMRRELPFSSPRLAAAAEELANLSATLRDNTEAVKEEIMWSPDAEASLQLLHNMAHAGDPEVARMNAEGGDSNLVMGFLDLSVPRQDLEQPAHAPLTAQTKRKRKREASIQSQSEFGAHTQPERDDGAENAASDGSASPGMQQFNQPATVQNANRPVLQYNRTFPFFQAPMSLQSVQAGPSPQQLSTGMMGNPTQSSLSPIPLFLPTSGGYPMPAFPMAFPVMWNGGAQAAGMKGDAGAPSSPTPAWMVWGPPVPVPVRRNAGDDTARSTQSSSTGNDNANAPMQLQLYRGTQLPREGPESRSSEEELMPLAFGATPYLAGLRSVTPLNPDYFNPGKAGARTAADPESSRPPSASMFFEKGESNPFVQQPHTESGGNAHEGGTQDEQRQVASPARISTPLEEHKGRQSSQSNITQTAEIALSGEAGAHHGSPAREP